MQLAQLIQENWKLNPERFSAIAFLERGDERILYDTRNQRELLRYHSTYATKNNGDNWAELCELLSLLGGRR